MTELFAVKLLRAAHELEEVLKDFYQALEDPEGSLGQGCWKSLEKRIIDRSKDKGDLHLISFFLDFVLVSPAYRRTFARVFIDPRPEVEKIFEDAGLKIRG